MHYRYFRKDRNLFISVLRMFSPLEITALDSSGASPVPYSVIALAFFSALQESRWLFFSSFSIHVCGDDRRLYRVECADYPCHQSEKDRKPLSFIREREHTKVSAESGVPRLSSLSLSHSLCLSHTLIPPLSLSLSLSLSLFLCACTHVVYLTTHIGCTLIYRAKCECCSTGPEHGARRGEQIFFSFFYRARFSRHARRTPRAKAGGTPRAIERSIANWRILELFSPLKFNPVRYRVQLSFLQWKRADLSLIFHI